MVGIHLRFAPAVGAAVGALGTLAIACRGAEPRVAEAERGVTCGAPAAARGHRPLTVFFFHRGAAAASVSLWLDGAPLGAPARVVPVNAVPDLAGECPVRVPERGRVLRACYAGTARCAEQTLEPGDDAWVMLDVSAPSAPAFHGAKYGAAPLFM